MPEMRLVLKNKEGNILNSILSEFAEEDYVWRLINLEYCFLQECTAEDINGIDFDANGAYSAQQILDFLPKTDYYLLFATLIAYSGMPSKVATYGNFCNSNGVLIVDIEDVCYLSIYAKKEELYDKVISAVSNCIDEEEGIVKTDKSCNDRIIWDD